MKSLDSRPNDLTMHRKHLVLAHQLTESMIINNDLSTIESIFAAYDAAAAKSGYDMNALTLRASKGLLRHFQACSDGNDCRLFQLSLKMISKIFDPLLGSMPYRGIDPQCQSFCDRVLRSFAKLGLISEDLVPGRPRSYSRSSRDTHSSQSTILVPILESPEPEFSVTRDDIMGSIDPQAGAVPELPHFDYSNFDQRVSTAVVGEIVCDIRSSFSDANAPDSVIINSLLMKMFGPATQGSIAFEDDNIGKIEPQGGAFSLVPNLLAPTLPTPRNICAAYGLSISYVSKAVSSAFGFNPDTVEAVLQWIVDHETSITIVGSIVVMYLVTKLDKHIWNSQGIEQPGLFPKEYRVLCCQDCGEAIGTSKCWYCYPSEGSPAPQAGWFSVSDELNNFNSTLDKLRAGGININHSIDDGTLSELRTLLAKVKIEHGVSAPDHMPEMAKPVLGLCCLVLLCFGGYKLFKVVAQVVGLDHQAVDIAEKISPQAGVWTPNASVHLIMAYVYWLFVQKNMEKESMLSFLKDVSLIPKIRDGVEFSVSWLWEVIRACLAFIYEKTEFASLKRFCKENTKFSNFVDEIDEFVSQHGGDKTLNYTVGMKLEKLFVQYRALYRSLPNDPATRDVKAMLDSAMKTLEPMRVKAGRSNLVGNGPRAEPLAVLIVGPSGTGKSTIAPFVLMNLIARTIPECDKKAFIENHNDFIFNRVHENEYWDSYHGQWATLYDDLGQEVDVPGVSNNSYFEVIRAINSNNFHLHMAHLEDKSGINFKSRIVFATSNRGSFKNLTSIFQPEAFERRWKHVYVQVPKKEFCTDNTKDVNDIWARRLDLSKVAEEHLFTFDHVEFHHLSLENGRCGYAPISYKELTDLLVDSYHSQNERSMKILDAHTHAKYAALGLLDPVTGLPNVSFENGIPKPGPVTPQGVDIKVDINVEESEEEKPPSLLSRAKSSAVSLFNLIGDNKGITIALCLVSLVAPIMTVLSAVTEPQGYKTKSGRRHHSRKGVVRKAMLTAQAGMGPTTADFATKVFNKNLYSLTVCGVHMGSVIFVKDTFALMPAHFLDYIENVLSKKEKTYADKELVIRRYHSSVPFHFSYNDLEISTDDDIDIDVCLVRFPLQFPRQCDIMSAFRPINSVFEDTPNLALSVANGSVHMLITAKGKAQVNKPYGEGEADAFKIDYGWRYNIPTKKGQCGFPVYHAYEGAEPTIVGMHVAGDGSSGFCIRLDRDWIQLAINAMSGFSNDVISVSLDPVEPIPQGCDTTKVVLSKCKQPTIPFKTSVVPSVLYESWGAAKCAPAQLQPFFNKEGRLVDPSSLAHSKYSGCGLPKINFGLLEAIGDYWTSKNLRATRGDAPWAPRVFSFEEAVKGVPAVDFCESIPRNTSCGYPWNLQGGTQKKKFFGFGDEFEFSSSECVQLRKRVEEVVANASLGIRSEFAYMDFLKDERRPLEKVEAGKTRLVSAAPVDLVIVTRMYFLDFIRSSMSGMVSNGMAMGMDPVSQQWDMLYKHLSVNGTRAMNCFAGDFSNFDGSECSALMRETLRMAHAFYADANTPDFTIREVLFEEMMNSRHVNSSFIEEWLGSVPSGAVLTTLTNSVSNLCVISYALISAVLRSEGHDPVTADHATFALLVPEILDDIRIADFGDDVIFTVADYLLKYVEGDPLVKELASIGMKFTDEKKNESLLVRRNITECTFLKRSFSKIPEHPYYVGALDLETIFEAPYWTKKGKPDEEVITTFESMLGELSLHGREVFREHSPKMLAAAAKILEYSPPIKSFDSVLQNKLSEHSYF